MKTLIHKQVGNTLYQRATYTNLLHDNQNNITMHKLTKAYSVQHIYKIIAIINYIFLEVQKSVECIKSIFNILQDLKRKATMKND